MARVEIASQAWGWLVDNLGNPLGGTSATLKNLDGSNATTWTAVTGGTSSTSSLTSSADGTLPRFVEEDSYTLTAGGTTRQVEAVSGSGQEHTSVRDFWSAAHADDTLSIEAAWAYVRDTATGTWIDNPSTSGFDVGGPTLYFPSKQGGYTYAGTGLTDSAGKAIPVIRGDGAETVEIRVPDGVDFLTVSQVVRKTRVEGVTIRGGRNVIRYTSTSVNAQLFHTVRDCVFVDYTGAAISHLASDMPYWNIAGNVFMARTDVNSMGVALGGLTDGSVIERNAFVRNRVHVKLTNGGLNAYLDKNTFIRWDTARTQGPSIDLWVVPNPSTSTNAGNGLVCSRSKFGNENLVSGDYMIVYADEGSGTDRADKFPNLGADSTGFIVGHTFRDNGYYGSSTAVRPLVYSTTPNVRACAVAGTVAGLGTSTLGASPGLTYCFQFRTVPLTPDRFNSSNTAGPFTGESIGHAASPIALRVSNADGVGFSVDPSGQRVGAATAPQVFAGGSDGADYIPVLSTALTSFGLLNSTTRSSVTDSLGGGDAIELTANGSGRTLASATLTGLVAGLPLWVEFDVERGASSPLDEMGWWILTGATLHREQYVEVPASTGRFPRYRFLVPGLRDVTGTVQLAIGLRIVASGTFRIGRVRVYHAREPVANGERKVPTTAAAATLTLPQGSDVHIISGNTGVTSITATGWEGRTVKLVFTGTPTITDGSNLKLAGNFVATADDVLTLVCAAGNWYQVAGSAN